MRMRNLSPLNAKLPDTAGGVKIDALSVQLSLGLVRGGLRYF